jgi:hypothetical protein
MRTTINLPDGLLERAKREAENQGLTLGDLIAQSLRASLLRRSPEAESAPFRLVTFGKGGLLPGLSYDRLKDLLDAEDVERVGTRLTSRAADGDDAPTRR